MKPHGVLLRAAFAAVQQMPARYHKRRGHRFDPRHSRVLVWLGRSPAVRDHLFEMFRSSGAIVFDRQTGNWRGKDVAR